MSSPGSDPHQQAIDEVLARIMRAQKDAIHTSHELRQRMNAGYVKRQIGLSFNKKIGSLHEEISDYYDNWSMIMLETFTRNPLTTALVGLGILWLLKNSSEIQDEWTGKQRHAANRWQEPETYDGPAIHVQIKKNLQSVKGKIQEQDKEWKEESEQKLQELKGYAKNQASCAKKEFHHLLENNPLALGGIMLAIGAAIAATLPSSRKENHWMGNSREKMLNAVKTKVKETVDDAKRETQKLAENISGKAESAVSA